MEVETLNPDSLYTQESIVFETGIKNADLQKPIFFGRDIKGNTYVTDGNHRAKKASLEGKPLTGIKISEADYDVAEDNRFHLVKDVKVINK